MRYADELHKQSRCAGCQGSQAKFELVLPDSLSATHLDACKHFKCLQACCNRSPYIYCFDCWQACLHRPVSARGAWNERG